MMTNEDATKFWESLSASEEDSYEVGSGTLKSPDVEGLSQRPSFTDRMAKRFAHGLFPLFLFSTLSMIYVGFWGIAAVLLGGPLLLLILCWLVSPLLRFRRNPWAFVLICPLLALFSVAASVLPVFFYNGIDFLQLGLENLFTSSAASVLILAMLILLALSYRFQKTHPWVRCPQPSRWRLALAMVTLLGPFLLAGYFVATSLPGKQARVWIESVQTLPPDSSGPSTGEWEVLFTRHTLTELDPPVERRAGFDKLYLELLESLRKGMPEVDYDRDLTARMIGMQLERSDSALDASQKAELAYFFLHARLNLRPQNQYIGAQRVLEGYILSYLSTMESNAESLALWAGRIATLSSLLPQSALEEWDLNARDYFFGEKQKDKLVIATIGAEVPERKVVRPLGNSIGIEKETAARPLKFFGRNISPSPTQIAIRWRESRALDDWARLRGYLLILAEPQARYEHMRRHGDAKGGSELYENLDQDFWDQLAGRRYVDTLGLNLESARLLLQLRKVKLQTGTFPATLEELVPEQDLARWKWSQSGSSWKLVDHHQLLQQKVGKPHPGWVLK